MSNRVFAHLYDNKVIGYINEVNNIEEEWNPDIIATLVDVTDADPKPEIGWVYEGGEFSPPPPYVPANPQEEMTTALMNGCEVHSTAKPALNAKYFASGPTWGKMTNEVMYIVSFNKFSGGLTQVEWPTKDGSAIFTDKLDFKNVVQAIGDWLTLWERYVAGNAASPPADIVTVA